MFSTSTAQILQNWSFIAQIVSASSVFFVAWQVRVSLKDIRIKSRREAVLISMQQTDRFASKILPEYLLVVKELKLKGIVLTRRKMFQKSALDAELKGSDKFRNIIKQIDADEDLKGKIANVLNQMEAMAMVFVGGVGDEEFVFSSLCNIFCTIVEEYWFFIAVNRKDDGTIKLYENLVKLHSIWSGRAEKTSINAKIQDLLIRKGGIEDKKVVPIGL